MTIFTSPFATTKSRSTQRETDDTVSMNTLQGLYVTAPGQPQEDMDTEETNPYKDHNGACILIYYLHLPYLTLKEDIQSVHILLWALHYCMHIADFV